MVQGAKRAVFNLSLIHIFFNEPVHELLEKPFMMVVFGFLGCWVLIIAAKIIMTPLLQRDEDYYQKGDDDADV